MPTNDIDFLKQQWNSIKPSAGAARTLADINVKGLDRVRTLTYKVARHHLVAAVGGLRLRYILLRHQLLCLSTHKAQRLCQPTRGRSDRARSRNHSSYRAFAHYQYSFNVSGIGHALCGDGCCRRYLRGLWRHRGRRHRHYYSYLPMATHKSPPSSPARNLRPKQCRPRRMRPKSQMLTEEQNI